MASNTPLRYLKDPCWGLWRWTLLWSSLDISNLTLCSLMSPRPKTLSQLQVLSLKFCQIVCATSRKLLFKMHLMCLKHLHQGLQRWAIQGCHLAGLNGLSYRFQRTWGSYKVQVLRQNLHQSNYKTSRLGSSMHPYLQHLHQRLQRWVVQGCQKADPTHLLYRFLRTRGLYELQVLSWKLQQNDYITSLLGSSLYLYLVKASQTDTMVATKSSISPTPMYPC